MLSTTRVLRVLFLFLFTLTSANAWFDGVIFERAGSDSAVGSVTTGHSAVTDPSTTPVITSPVTSAGPPTTSPSPSPSTTPTTPPTTSPSLGPSTSQGNSVSSHASTPSGNSQSTPITTPPSPTTTPPSMTVSRLTRTTVITDGDNTYTSVFTGSTTTLAEATSLADSSNSSGGGLSSQTRSIIGGVIGGIGGAIILAGIFFAIWRLRSRRKNRAQENDDMLMGRGYNGEHEKNADGSPFKNTLENYHNPTAQGVNASSNF